MKRNALSPIKGFSFLGTEERVLLLDFEEDDDEEDFLLFLAGEGADDRGDAPLEEELVPPAAL